MNKDLDERLVPKGEYRDAMNIQVSTSEGSDVGTVQNILGNSEIAGPTFTTDAVCVGAIADEKNDKLYWFIKDVGGSTPYDGIFEYTSDVGVIKPVLIDTNLDVLKFNSSKIITGINIIDDMLFWTDNQNEPKKINIQRCKAGTTSLAHTNFINEDRDITNVTNATPIREEHITVIKKAPKKAPTVELISQRTNDDGKIYTGVMRITPPPTPITVASPYDGISYQQSIADSYNAQNESSMFIAASPQNHHYDFSNLSVGDYFDTYIETDINGESGFSLDWSKGDTLLFKEFGGEFYNEPPSIPLRDYSVKAKIRHVDQKVKNNIGVPKDTDGIESYAEVDYSVTWVQGTNNVGRISLWHDRGFDGVIKNIRVYDVSDPSQQGVDIMINGNFNTVDALGAALPQWGLSSCSPNPGGITDDNGNIIDQALFPCYPGRYSYGDAPWVIDYQSWGTAGSAKAADGMTVDAGGKHVLTRLGSGNSWAKRANNNDITAATASTFTTVPPTSINTNDSQLMNSYQAINQFGYLVMEGVPVATGKTYRMDYEIADTGHTYGKRNGSLLLANHGLVDPWLYANYFTDMAEEMAQNESFITPDGDGDRPRYWSFSDSGTGAFLYIPGQHYIECGKAEPFYLTGSHIVGTPSIPIEVNDINATTPGVNDISYDVSFELTDVGNFTAAGEPISSGGIYLSLVGPDPDVDYWRTPEVDQAGVYNFTIIPIQYDTASDNPYTFGPFDSGNRIQFESNSNAIGRGFVGRIQNVSVKRSNAPNANVRCEVLDINNPPAAPEYSELRYAVDRLDKANKIFEFKFPRFAYRYQYEDKEYSTISPFSPVAFMSGEFNYHTKKGYNLGMTNRLIEANIKDFRSDIPDGVVAIDILYKDDASPNIYVVDTIKPKHSTLIGNEVNVWEKGEYTISTEQVSNVIASNQLLRPWDAVPRKALAQDISGNRIIYGNYVQGYDLKYIDNDISEEYYPDFSFDILNTSNPDLLPKKSIKSLREYQLGVVFVDQYGRETPVISNSSGTKTLEKKESENINQIKIGFNNNKFPQNMKYFKFFVKETSNEYYNLAMDRWYDAEDGGVWLAFPSSDRNKVDIDTFLILKKAQGTNAMVIEEAKYKVLDIQSNAPAFIKQRKLLISTTIHVESTTNIFEPINFIADGPRVGEASFKMNYLPFLDTSGSDLDEINDSNLWIDFENIDGNVTKRYRISKITNDHRKNADDDGAELDAAQYSVILTEGFGSDINLITDDSLTGLSPTKIADGAIVNIYKYTEEDQAKFDGRFFVKISVDLAFFTSIISGTGSGKYRRVSSKKLYYLSPDNSDLHSSDLTGQTKGLYDSLNGDFGRFAPFFRNYTEIPSLLSVTNGGDVGQYAFGPDSDTERPWLQELAYYTTVPSTDLIPRGGTNGNVSSAPEPKVADSHGWTALQRGGVFNTKHEQTHGDVWFIDGGPFHGENASESGDELKWADGETRLVKPEDSFPGLSTGIETGDFTYFNIAVGGIYDPEYTYGNGGSIDKFFNLRDGGNTSYEENTQNLVGRFSPGQKFRFREDPSNDIYTIQPNVENQRRVRWNTIQLSEDTATPNPNFAWDFDDDGTWSGASPVGNGDINNDYTVFGTQLSPNFSRGWKPRVLNSAGGGNVDWNPTGDLGPITNGLELSVNLSEDFTPPAAGSVPNIYVDVSSLRGTHTTTGVEHNITVGMIMISHSDGVTDCVFDSGDDGAGADTGKAYLAIYEIEEIDGGLSFRLHLTGYSKILYNSDITNTTLGLTKHEIFITTPTTAQAMVFAQPTMNGYSQYSVNRINAQDPTGLGWTGPTFDLLTGDEIDSGNPGIMAIGYNLDFVEEVDLEADSGSILSTNPAVWETEPKESIDLDIYHEASGLNPLEMEDDTKFLTIPIGSIVETVTGVFIEPGTTISGVNFDGTNCEIVLSSLSDNAFEENGIPVQGTLVGVDNVSGSIYTPYIAAGDRLKITKPNGESIIVTIAAPGWPTTIDSVSNPDANGRTTTFLINTKLCSSSTKYILNWHNCYSFGNGVESNRIRDNFNLPFISNGPKVSTTLEGDYNEEHRKYGLIYSGLYNSNSGVNNLNQFIAAEKITKDINPIYGSIQKLHSRDSDLVTLCEDKCLRILANKDAVFNADGNPNLVATSNVLGQTIPFSGEFGISKNPESFASESYRAYFTDKVRGTVMRLSKDGLTPISMYGMKDWFKDNLKLSSKLIGSYDDRKDEYNITLNNSTDGDPKTVSFKEDVKGWVSFKSFVPEFGISMASNYHTMKAGRLYKHHDEGKDRNTFYNDDLVSSSVNVIFNEGPGSIKSFHTLNYEGSQSKITKFLEEEKTIDFQPPTTYNNQEHYNLSAKPGWSVGSIATDEDTGYITDFIEKEGKWFANMNKRIDTGTPAGASISAIITPTTGITPSAETIPTAEITLPVVVSESDLKNDEPISQITVKTNNKNNTNGNRY